MAKVIDIVFFKSLLISRSAWVTGDSSPSF